MDKAIRSDAGMSIMAACGVSPALVDKADGGGQREAWRRFLQGSLDPAARLVETELAEKLDTPGLSLAFDNLYASDLSGSASATASCGRKSVGSGRCLGSRTGLRGWRLGSRVEAMEARRAAVGRALARFAEAFER